MRSFLMIPALRLERYWQHVARLPSDSLPDCVVIDLEDSVPPQRKAEAAKSFGPKLRELMSSHPLPVSIAVKVDRPNSEFASEQVAQLASLTGLISMVKIGKVESVADLEIIERHASALNVPVYPTIETPPGFRRRDEICEWCAAHEVRYVSFGAGDMSASLMIERDYALTTMQTVFALLAIACHEHELVFVDSPSRVIPDSLPEPWDERVRSECRWSFANGARAKTAIHPAQLPIIHRCWDERFAVARVAEVERQFWQESEERALRDSRNGEYIGTPALKYARKLSKSREA